MPPRKITHNTTLGVLSGSVVLKLCSGDPWPSLTSAWISTSLFTLECYSIVWIGHILSVNQLVKIWVVSTFWLLRITWQ